MQLYEPYLTERLLLVPTTKDDAAFILKLLNQPKWIKNIGDRNVHTLEQAERYIETKMLSQYYELGYGNYKIRLKENGTKVGICGLYNRAELAGIDLGYALLEEFEGKGYATEAGKLVLDLAKNKFKINELNAITLSENIPSCNLLEKLGFENQGSLNLKGDDENLILYRRIL